MREKLFISIVIIFVIIMTGCQQNQEGFEEALFDDSEYYADNSGEESLFEDVMYYDDDTSDEDYLYYEDDGCFSGKGVKLMEGDNVYTGGLYIIHGFIEEINGTQARVRWFSITDTWGDPLSKSDENFYLTLAGYQLNHSYWIEGSKLEYERN